METVVSTLPQVLLLRLDELIPDKYLDNAQFIVSTWWLLALKLHQIDGILGKKNACLLRHLFFSFYAFYKTKYLRSFQ